MWQMWNKPIVTQKNNDPDYLLNSSQSEEETNFEMNLPTVQYVSSSTLVLPSPPVRICKNSFGQQHHLLLSVFAHFMVWICRLGMRKYRAFLKQRRQILQEKKWKQISSSMCHKNANQSIELERVSTSHEESYNTIRCEDIDDSQSEYFDSTLECDIEDDDEVENNAMAVLQHYIIVWLSIVTSPKGSQLDSWLMVMVIMDIAPLAWCISMYLRSVFSERLPTSSSETSLSNRRNSNNLPNSSRTMSFTFVEVAEILSVTMKKWSPAYQLNEMIT